MSKKILIGIVATIKSRDGSIPEKYMTYQINVNLIW